MKTILDSHNQLDLELDALKQKHQADRTEQLEAFGKKLQAIRGDLSCAEMAALAGCSATLISMVENGKQRASVDLVEAYNARQKGLATAGKDL